MSNQHNAGTNDMPGQPRPSGWDGARWGDNEKEQAAIMSSRQGGRDDSALERFMGGSPLGVVLRLFVVSLVVGALLMWMEVTPLDLFRGIERFFRRIWNMGFDALNDLFTYAAAGAMIVVPVWFILRLTSYRRRR